MKAHKLPGNGVGKAFSLFYPLLLISAIYIPHFDPFCTIFPRALKYSLID
jgi:hypothetical protein